MIISIILSTIIFAYFFLMILGGIRREARSHLASTSRRGRSAPPNHKHTPAGPAELRGGTVQQRCSGCDASVGVKWHA